MNLRINMKVEDDLPLVSSCLPSFCFRSKVRLNKDSIIVRHLHTLERSLGKMKCQEYSVLVYNGCYDLQKKFISYISAVALQGEIGNFIDLN